MAVGITVFWHPSRIVGARPLPSCLAPRRAWIHGHAGHRTLPPNVGRSCCPVSELDTLTARPRFCSIVYPFTTVSTSKQVHASNVMLALGCWVVVVGGGVVRRAGGLIFMVCAGDCTTWDPLATHWNATLLPPVLTYPANTGAINLQCQNIETVPSDAFGVLSQLTTLTLSQNRCRTYSNVLAFAATLLLA